MNILDNPETTIQRGKVIKQKYFLKHVYIDFYKRIKILLSPINKKGNVLELGSGGGFIKQIIPQVKTSDILQLPNIDFQFSALKMPFKKQSVHAFVMIDVFHHINNVEQFFKEADRCLKKGGQIIMIEPASTFFGRLIYTYFHPEPYKSKAKWTFTASGPLSGANSALPWIVFYRDKKKFEKKFPNFKITRRETHTPFKYLLSGGFSFPQLLPNSFYFAVTTLERFLEPINKYIGMFYTITIQKQS